MRLPLTGVRLPWQLVELQEPGPLYWPGTPAAAARPAGFCERVSPANQFASGNTAKRSAARSNRRGFSSGCIFIFHLGKVATLCRSTLARRATALCQPAGCRRKSTQPLCSVFTGGKTPQAALLILLGSSDVNQIDATFSATWHRIAALILDRAARVCYMSLLELSSQPNSPALREAEWRRAAFDF